MKQVENYDEIFHKSMVKARATLEAGENKGVATHDQKVRSQYQNIQTMTSSRL